MNKTPFLVIAVVLGQFAFAQDKDPAAPIFDTVQITGVELNKNLLNRKNFSVEVDGGGRIYEEPDFRHAWVVVPRTPIKVPDPKWPAEPNEGFFQKELRNGTLYIESGRVLSDQIASPGESIGKCVPFVDKNGEPLPTKVLKITFRKLGLNPTKPVEIPWLMVRTFPMVNGLRQNSNDQENYSRSLELELGFPGVTAKTRYPVALGPRVEIQSACKLKNKDSEASLTLDDLMKSTGADRAFRTSQRKLGDRRQANEGEHLKAFEDFLAKRPRPETTENLQPKAGEAR